MISLFVETIGKRIEDVIIVGVADIEDGWSEMTPILTDLYVEVSESLLRLQSVVNYSRLRVSKVADLVFDLDIDEDFSPAKASIGNLILRDSLADNRIQSVEIFGVVIDSEKGEVECDAILIHLVCGQELFFDPTFHFGINVGGREQLDAWKNNYPNQEGVPPKSIVILPNSGSHD